MGLEPDMFVIGKAIAGGIPAAAFGLDQATAERVWKVLPKVPPTVRQSAHAGMGGTLAGNALTVGGDARRALRGAHPTTPSRACSTSPRGCSAGVNDAITKAALPWHATHVGARVETLFASNEPRNAAEVKTHRNPDLEALLHLYLMNRGVLITPFHNMMLCCPGTTAADVDRHNAVFGEFVAELVR